MTSSQALKKSFGKRIGKKNKTNGVVLAGESDLDWGL